jgi:hypothetical protein
MATINVRNESNRFIKLQNESFIHKPADAIEDITVELTDVTSDKIFNVYSDEGCGIFLGTFKVLFRVNDGVYLNLSNFDGNKLKGDVNFDSNIEVYVDSEEKLLDWVMLNASSVINVTLSNA